MTADPARHAATQKRRQGHRTIAGRRLTTDQWRDLRNRWQARLPQPCPRCSETIHPWDPWDLDHVGNPVAFGAGDDDVRPAHRSCNRRAGGELGGTIADLGRKVANGTITPRDIGAATAGAAAVFADGTSPPTATRSLGFSGEASDAPDDLPPDPTTPGPSDSCWDAAPWLAPLRDVPPDATWPRLMSGPHPKAVGSWGADACAWAEFTVGRTPRWWQRLAMSRLLEFDADGCLVWVDAFVSTARQVGKSVLLGDIALWRLHQSERFGEEQLVMHTGKDILVCAQVQRATRNWARDRGGGWKTRETNGGQEVLSPDGSRWIVRALGSVYGYPASLALCDEAWDVPAHRVEEGLEPTLTERESGQLLMFSTAHRSATSLVPVRRGALLDSWGRDTSSLILEWSALRDADLGDRAAWRQASPHWSTRRERLLEAKYSRAVGGQSVDPDEDDPTESFRSQFLNVWPGRRIVSSTRTELLIEADQWALAADLHVPVPDGPVVVGVEDWFGLGAAAACAVNLPDGRVLVWGDVFAHRGEAYAWAAFTTGRRPGSRVVHGASMPTSEAAEHLPEVELVKAGTADTYAALPLLRSLVRSHRLVHSGDDAMTGQVCAVRVAPTSSGGLTPAHRGVRSDLLKAMAWAVASVAEPAADTPLPFFAY